MLEAVFAILPLTTLRIDEMQAACGTMNDGLYASMKASACAWHGVDTFEEMTKRHDCRQIFDPI